MAIKILKVVLAIALVGGLFVAGWNIYRRLPVNGQASYRGDADAQSEVALTIILRDGMSKPVNSTVEVYAIDVAAVQQEYFAIPRSQKSFDDFLSRRLKGLDPARGRFDGQGRAMVYVNPGNCWIHATAELPSGESLEWRMPISVGQSQTVELTTENAYEKTKKF